MRKDWQEATRRADIARARDLLDAGAAIDARDGHGQTALMNAAQSGHADLVRLLVARGAALNVTAKYNLSALMLAAIGGHAEVVRILLDAGADRGIRGTGAPGFHGKTAIALAEAMGRAEIVGLLRTADATE